MSVVLSCAPTGPKFAITADAVMPTITVTATLGGVTVDPRVPPAYSFSATLAFTGSVTPHGAGSNTTHRTITSQTGPSNRYVIPFSEVRGGVLIVSVAVRVGAQTLTAISTGLTIVGTNPTPAAIKVKANAIGATKARFRKQMRQESTLRQFGANGWPLFSGDNLGGVGLCQITRPPPTPEQIWNWKANVDAGWNLYLEKQRIAGAYAALVRNNMLPALVSTWNKSRLPATPIAVTLPDYTDDQLQLDTIRGFNGFAGGLHEFRVRRDTTADRLLVVTIDGSGTRGTAEWERVPVNERGTAGDPNYVNNVEAQADF